MKFNFETLKNFNAIAIATLLLLFVFSLFLLLLGGLSSGNSAKGVTVGEDSETVREELNIVVGQSSRKHSNATRAEEIRLWLRQGKNSYGKFSSYSRAVDRNIGFLDQTTLKARWYFNTNSQNITESHEIYRMEEGDNRVWQGTLLSVVSSDTDGDEKLTPSDKADLYFAREGELNLLTQGVDEVNEVLFRSNDTIFILRKNDELYTALFNPETVTLFEMQQLLIP